MLRVFAAALLGATLVQPLIAQTVSFSNHAASAPGLVAAHGDFNNDGREDFLYVTDPAHNNQWAVQVSVSTSDGGYKNGATYDVPQLTFGPPSKPVLADFNRDGKLDFAIAANNTIYVYFGNGDGTFRRGPAIQVDSRAIQDIVAADLNGDGKTDLVALSYDSFSNTDELDVYFSNGAGAFTAGPVTQLGTIGNPLTLLTGDFDGDGKADVAWLTCGGAGCEISIAYGDRTGKFPAFYGNHTTSGFSFIVADVNGDGRSDFIGRINGANVLDVWYGNSNRTLTQQEIPLAQCTFGSSVAVADFSGDGIPDIIVGEGPCSGSRNTQLAFLAGEGGGLFHPEQFIANLNGAFGDANDTVAMLGDRDSEPDVAFTQTEQAGGDPGTLDVFLNTTAAHFPVCSPPSGIRGIRVCSPVPGSTVTSPVHFAIGAAGSVPMRKVEVWVDGKKLKQVFGAFSDYGFMDARLTLASGKHTVTIFAAGWDNSLQKKAFSLTVH